MNEEYEFLIEKEEIWARMYIQLLEENSIEYTTVSVYGAGLTMKVGGQDIIKIYVPTSQLSKAKKIIKEIQK